MSETPDESSLAESKSSLAHVETKTGSSAKPVFKCGECGETQEIPASLLAKMEADEDITSSLPTHHDKPMQISVVA